MQNIMNLDDLQFLNFSTNDILSTVCLSVTLHVFFMCFITGVGPFSQVSGWLGGTN